MKLTFFFFLIMIETEFVAFDFIINNLKLILFLKKKWYFEAPRLHEHDEISSLFCFDETRAILTLLFV